MLHVRRINEADARSIWQIQRSSFHNGEIHPFQSIHNLAINGQGIVGVKDNVVVGYILIGMIERDCPKDTTLVTTLISVAVDEKYRGLGIAEEMLQYVISAANNSKNEMKLQLPLYLHVRTRNITAYKLYSYIGFIPICTVSAYYNHPPDDAYYMKYDLCDRVDICYIHVPHLLNETPQEWIDRLAEYRMGFRRNLDESDTQWESHRLQQYPDIDDPIDQLISEFADICGNKISRGFIKGRISTNSRMENDKGSGVWLLKHKDKIQGVLIYHFDLETVTVDLICSSPPSSDGKAEKKEERRYGGANLMAKLIEMSQRKHKHAILLDSIVESIGFYRKLGFINSRGCKEDPEVTTEANKIDWTRDMPYSTIYPFLTTLIRRQLVSTPCVSYETCADNGYSMILCIDNKYKEPPPPPSFDLKRFIVPTPTKISADEENSMYSERKIHILRPRTYEWSSPGDGLLKSDNTFSMYFGMSGLPIAIASGDNLDKVKRYIQTATGAVVLKLQRTYIGILLYNQNQILSVKATRLSDELELLNYYKDIVVKQGYITLNVDPQRALIYRNVGFRFIPDLTKIDVKDVSVKTDSEPLILTKLVELIPKDKYTEDNVIWFIPEWVNLINQLYPYGLFLKNPAVASLDFGYYALEDTCKITLKL